MKLHHFRPKKEKRGLIFKVFVVVAIIQVALLVGFSSWIISTQYFTEEEPFIPPPQTDKIPIPEIERKVQVRKDQKKSKKTTKRISVPMPTQVVNNDVNVVIPDIGLDGIAISPITNEEIKTNIKIDLPQVDIYGIKNKVEKVLICIDTSPYLMSEERGGLDTYKVIKEDIKKVIDGLPPTVLFNLMAYDLRWPTINTFQSNLVPATKFNKRIAANWLNPLNSSLDRIGSGGNNYKFKFPFMLPQPPHSAYYSPDRSKIYKVYQAAIEQGADTIYFLTTGWTDPDDIKMPWKDSDFVNYRREEENFEKNKARQLRAAGWTDEKLTEYNNEEELAKSAAITQARDWLRDENNRRKEKGLSQIVSNPSDIMWQKNFIKLPDNRPPGIGGLPAPRFKSYGRKGLFDAFEPIFKQVYRDKNLRLPTVNIILFKGINEDISPNDQRIIRSFTKANGNGRSRTLRGLKPVSEVEAEQAQAKAQAEAKEEKK